ncbi:MULTISPECIES: DMT family transporter [Agrobacterium]|uniref:Multidrug DMT transporter permease n=2 Tax=Agrobacterium tumefaciens complex TaxID=1183400 RepID=A0AAE6EIS8_AGRTU|nr:MULTISPECIES: DMT family transporter [Agrobacterium]ASK40650.1 multidrug DMT transporter permease [Agrobacterium genomosp. 6]ASK41414.1 multidrug DMT transporter permease [Agrobacterium genomosp. 6]QCL77543.1 multidrug DMT transporter permease [Agrobacterium tumefaciens]QCL83031.1 multidrug DMT transporter permease [Agrobacterium tumefaciens]
MAFASLLLVVLASFIHASWNLLAKRAASVGPIFVFAYNLIACISYAPWVLYLLMTGDGVVWTWIGVGFVLTSGLIHLAYSLCLQRGYQVADLSVVYPVARGTGPMLSTLGAFLILGEIPSGQGIIGLFFVVAGIGLIATQGDLSAFLRPGGQTGVRWGAATGGLIASYTVVDAYAVKTLGIAPVVLDWFSNLLRFVLLAPLVIANPRRAIGMMRGYWWIAVGVGLLSPLSYILVLAALTSGAPLSLVAPMREMSMMVGALMGMVILRERVGPWRLAGCGVLIVGVILLSGG